MLYLFLGQISVHFALSAPQPWIFLMILLCGIVCIFASKLRSGLSLSLLLLILGGLWQLAFEPLNPISELRLLESPPSSASCDRWLWFLCKARREDEPIPHILLGSHLNMWAIEARDYLVKACLEWDPTWGPWLLGLMLGETQDKGWTSLYQDLGLLHVLVVSGAHFTMLAKALGFVIYWPGRKFYVKCWIAWPAWVSYRLAADILLLFALAFYLLIVDFNPPCQRAFLQSSFRILKVWVLKPEEPDAARVAMLQALLFPCSFFSMSNALSWSAWLCVKQGKSFRAYLDINIQLLSLAFFGSLAPLGWLINRIFEPVWGAFLIVGLATVLLDLSWLNLSLSYGCLYLHKGLLFAHDIQLALWGASALQLRFDWAYAVRWMAMSAWLLMSFWFFQSRTHLQESR